jgi:outer membrane protein W
LGGTANPAMAPAVEAPTQGVVSPVTDHPGEVLNAPVPTAAQAQAPGPNVASYTVSPYTPAAQAQIVGAQSVTSAQALPASNDDRVRLSITPHAGVSIMNADSAFTVSGKGAAGIGLGMGVTDNLSVEIGYTYAEYGIGLGGLNASYYNPYFNGNSDTYTLKQNVFDAWLKLSLLGADSKFRPYIGGGAAYSKGYLNYPTAVAQLYQGINNFSPDFESSDFLGYLSVGFDAQVSKTVSIGMNARYYKVMSDSENENLYYGSFYGGGFNSDPTKLQAGTQLAQSSFYSLLGTVTFAF